MKKLFTLLCFCAMTLMVLADKQVHGVVVDETGEPVIGASIQVVGTSLGTISDANGAFSLSVPNDTKTLKVTYVGKQDTEVEAKANVRVVLRDNAEVIQEIVVTGYGNVAKGSFVGSTQAVDADVIDKKSPSEATSALRGEVAGVQSYTGSAQPGKGTTIVIRGPGSVNASATPLYVVDGMPFDGDISSIDPSDIASMTVLKDATATSLYGSRGSNGVVLITTKKGTSGEEGKIDVDVRYGGNMHILPMYDVISTPEEYVLLGWQGMFNAAYSGNIDQAMKNANTKMKSFLGQGKGYYNMWNVTGDQLVNTNLYKRGDHQLEFNPAVQRKAGYETLDSWKDAMFRVGQKVDASVKFRGGSEHLTYYTSFGYLLDQGYYKNSDFQRFNVRSNLEYNPKKWLKASLNIQYAYTTMNAAKQGSDMDNGFAYVNGMPSLYQVYERDESGNKIWDPITNTYRFDYGMHQGYGRPFGSGINPAASLILDQEKNVAHNLVANAGFEIKLYDGLKAVANVSAMYYGAKANDLSNKYYGNAAGIGYVTQQNVNYFVLYAQQQLEYGKTFDVHSIRALVGHETQLSMSDMIYGHKSTIAQPNSPELSNAITMLSVEGNSSSEAMESYLATVSYSYDERYLFTANYRADGSSKFAKDHRWGHFGSVGIGWNFTNESFTEPIQEWVRNGKLRLSWGVLGNQEIGNYYYSDHYSIVNADGNGTLGYVWTYKGNPNLTWERSQVLDLGLEFDISKYLSAEIDYFYKYTDNLLFSRYVAPSLGYAGIYVNDGAMSNQGIEFQFKAHAVDTRNVKLDIRLNGAHYANKMVKMPTDHYEDGVAVPMVMSGGMSVGHSGYEYYLPEYAGVDPTTGQAQYYVYYDANKYDWEAQGGFDPSNSDLEEATIAENGTPNYINSVHEYELKNPNANIQKTVVSGSASTYAGSTYVGKSALPALDGGLGLDLEVYGVTLSVSTSYRIGGYGYDNSYAQLMSTDQIGQYNWHVDIRNAWTPFHTDTDIPRLSNGADKYATMASTRFLTSNSYFAINNISLGYRFPKKLIEKIKLQSLQFNVSADNLAIASARKGYNPMTSFSGSSDSYQYTPLTAITGGFKLTF